MFVAPSGTLDPATVWYPGAADDELKNLFTVFRIDRIENSLIKKRTIDPRKYVSIEEFLLVKRHMPQVLTKVVCGARTNEIQGSVPDIFIQIGCISQLRRPRPASLELRQGQRGRRQRPQGRKVPGSQQRPEPLWQQEQPSCLHRLKQDSVRRQLRKRHRCSQR